MPSSPSIYRSISASIAVAIVTIAAFALAQPALAGTTGTISGYVLTGTDTPLSGAKVTVASPTTSESTTTDAQGAFAFVDLPPDTYAITASKDGYQSIMQPGVTVVADNAVTVRLVTPKLPKLLTPVIVTARPSLLRPSTVQDVYNIRGSDQPVFNSLGGGGDLESAYSAIASLPGTFVPSGQSGWNQPVFVRGGDFTEIGYEFDGVPINRAFDHIPTMNLSDMGVAALDVYTGGAPANAESQGLSGYINQVVKQGTYPGFAGLDAGIGAPAYFNKLNLEAGGATPDKRFSYYAAFGGYNQSFRYFDQNNGAAISNEFGMPFDIGGGPNCFTSSNPSNFAGCYANHAFFQAFPAGPGGYVLGPYNMGKNASLGDRENIANFHFLVPRRNSSDHDDIQLLYDTSQITTYTYSSYSDWGGAPFWNGIDGAAGGFHSLIPGAGYPLFASGFQYDGPLLGSVSGTPGGAIDSVVPYLFPSEDQAGIDGFVPANQRDVTENGQSIVKVEYKHTFGTNAYARVYGYDYYSNEFIHSPNGNDQFFISTSPDFELWTHTHGYSANYVDQMNAYHLFDVQVSYSSSNNVFFNNGQMANANPLSPQSYFAPLVSQSAPTSGVCYNSALQPVSCEPTTAFVLNGGIPLCNGFTGGGACFLSYGLPFAPPPPGFEWLAVENGANGPSNSVTPRFTSFSIEDQYRPTDRLNINAGIRFDHFAFDIPSTAGGAARAFWFNSWNAVMCANKGFNGGNPIDETLLGLPVGTPCSTLDGILGPGWVQAHLTNASAAGASTSHSVFQPRLGATFDAGDDDVFRASWGVYAQAPATRAIENDALQQDLPDFIGPHFFALGQTTPVRDLRPPVSYNADFSWEHRFNGSDVAFKLTPFYRRTRDQVQSFFIDPTFGTTTDINAGRQTSFGAEFMLTKGSPDANGLSWQLAYTYTHSRIEYVALPNGSTLLSGVNAAIQQYNSYTSACAGKNPSTDPGSLCGVFGGANAMPTESNGVANPYFNAPVRPLLDPFGSYPTFDVIPTGLQLTVASYGVPDYTSFAATYRHDKWSFTPLVELLAGPRYGGPEQQIGVDPATCQPLPSGSVTGDKRYPFGGSGQPYDATTCTNTIFIPDQVTGNFDTPGAFRQPSQLTVNFQVSYRATPQTTLRLTAVNAILRCFGGDSEPWTVTNNHLCGYDVLPGHIPPVGNIFNPGDTIQRVVQFPYGIEQQAQPSPANLYFDVEVKL
ncbi:MAG TPA: TonB-dependent receptor [Candidatus Eremiobacteraceae bacterium]|nr:TonB-dependent receptor [Candidatus Eremiobacteraceae bacterium]